MRNLRTYTMVPLEHVAFDPDEFTAALKKAGFIFDSERCPVQLRQPYDKVFDEANGVVVWRQWDEELQ